MYLNVDTIQQSIDDGDVKKFAAFLWFKTRYSNSCYYKWSFKSISDKTKMSRTAVRKYIPEFIKLGWCREHSKNLIFKKTKELYATKINQYVKINTNGKIQDILNELYFVVLKRKANQFDYVKKLWKDKSNGKVQSSNHYKQIRKVCKGREIKTSAIQGFSFSLSKIANLFNTSPSTASRIMQTLNKKGKFMRMSNYEVFGNIKYKPWLKEKLRWDNGIFITKSGNVTKKLCNSYIF